MPGRWLLSLANVIFDHAVIVSVVEPTIADMRVEMLDARNVTRRLIARWRGYLAFWSLVAIAPLAFSQIARTTNMTIGGRAGVFVLMGLLGLAGGYLYARNRPVLYKSTAVMQVVAAKVPPHISGVKSSVTMPERMRATREIILSRTRLERLIKEFQLYPDEQKSMIVEEVVSLMRSRIVVTPNDFEESASSGEIAVSFTGDSPVAVLRVTERLAQTFMDESLKDAVRRAEGTSAFIEGQVDELERRILEQPRNADRAVSAAEALRREVLQSSYKTMLLRQLEASMAVDLERRQIGEQWNLLDAAQLPQRPIGPSLMETTLSGGGMGLSLALLMSLVDTGRRMLRGRRRALANDAL